MIVRATSQAINSATVASDDRSGHQSSYQHSDNRSGHQSKPSTQRQSFLPPVKWSTIVWATSQAPKSFRAPVKLSTSKCCVGHRTASWACFFQVFDIYPRQSQQICIRHIILSMFVSVHLLDVMPEIMPIPCNVQYSSSYLMLWSTLYATHWIDSQFTPLRTGDLSREYVLCIPSVSKLGGVSDSPYKEGGPVSV